jgi:ERF superfamily
MSEMQADMLAAANAGVPKTRAVALASEFTPAQLLHLAVIKKSDVAVIERLSVLAERWSERAEAQARLNAFNNAIADAKAEIGTIKKRSQVKFDSRKPGASSTDYMYEDFAEVTETIGPALHKYGLNWRFRLVQPSLDSVTVICVLSHRDGHFEETPLTAKVDPSGNKNHIQAISSAVTYLERITLKAAVGAAAGRDDDGRASGPPISGSDPDGEPVISNEQAIEIDNLLKQKGRALGKFLDWCNAGSLATIPLAFYDDIIDTLNRLPDAHP